MGSDYRRLHSQIVLVNDTGNEMIPDFFAERIGTTFADIIELKKPSARIVSGVKSRRGLCAVLTRALNQVHEYRNYFDNPANRRRFHRQLTYDDILQRAKQLAIIR